MKSAKPQAADAPSHRRSQPVRQTRTNPPRSSANATRSGAARDSLNGGGPVSDQPIDIFPAITHFADTITALPKELVRHFTLLKEVEAKIFAPEEQLFKLIAATRSLPAPEPRTNNDTSNTIAPGSAPMSAQGSSSGILFNQRPQIAPSADEPNSAVFDSSNIHRRQLFRQTAFKIQEMLVSLEEKNHVISTANEALQRQLARVEDVWPYLESEFSDEAKWGSTTHWAYPENRNGKSSQAERTRRDGAAAISAAAQALVEQAAARSDARKQAVQAKKTQKPQPHESDVDDHDARSKEGSKKSQPSKVRKTTETNNVGLGISTATSTNGNPPQKRRKVEKEKPTNGAVPPERAMSTVFGNAAPKAKPASPRETPIPEPPKKRKALPTSSGQSKKKNGATTISPSTTTSPVLGALPEPKATSRPSPPTSAPPRPTSSRARQNSLQSNSENGKAVRPPPPTNNKPNGNTPSTPELAQQNNWPRPVNEPKPAKEVPVTVKTEPAPKEVERTDIAPLPVPIVSNGRRESKAAEDADRKSEISQSLQQSASAVTTKSGRASKPSTPALPSAFQEPVRSRTTRNAEPTNNNGKKAQQKKSNNTTVQAPAPRLAEDGVSSMQGEDDEEDGDIDADEPTYCYCNSVSYGEMVACDSDDCAREWFHLACVGLKVAPNSKTKWYCEDCKERLKMGGKKVNGR
ncbi:Transcriptional regulatory protein PHO23 [Cladobotryum mycophilum]|uniref:Chromatin modification-related protein n=1 Tax=Cladobotryum mycophilum TaxID=491253 RepID=A0ABR0T163_9HYPO